MKPTLRELLERERHGILATLSARRAGWPFASIAPYALTAEAEPLLLFSDLAEHTRNLRGDPRASLLVHDSASLDDPQTGSRVTLLGTVELLPGDEVLAARKRYLGRHPEAADHLAMADFRLYVLRVVEARFISGFGDMGWLTAERLSAALSS